MSIAKLKQGIDSKDWQTVIEAYNNISGDNLLWHETIELEQAAEAAPKKRGRPKKAQVAQPTISSPPKTIVKSSRVSQALLANRKPNSFVDDFSISPEYKLKKNERKPPRLSTDRPTFQEVDATCTKCHKTESVSPGLAEIDPYYCNKCSSRRGK